LIKLKLQKFSVFSASKKGIGELKSEIIRKAIHFLIAFSPLMAAVNRQFTLFFLMAGVCCYTLMEYLRLSGTKVPVISSITRMASRPGDAGSFIMGPVTLGLGAFLALFLFPPQTAAIAIYALAFGDGFASLVGKFSGNWRPAILCGKSVEGSIACFTAVFISAYAVSNSVRISAIAAFTAMVVEAMPLDDYDNLAVPVTVGLIVQLALFQ
jgi:dolichol kinase